MAWVWQKIDVLLAAVFVAVAALAATQGHAFMTQYQARLATQLNLARATLTEVQTGLRYRLMSEVVRSELEGTAQARFNALDEAHGAIAGANIIIKPFVLSRRADPKLVEDTRRTFVPQVPTDAGAIFYAILGAIVGFAAYEILKLPFILLIREPRRRKFRKRG